MKTRPRPIAGFARGSASAEVASLGLGIDMDPRPAIARIAQRHNVAEGGPRNGSKPPVTDATHVESICARVLG
jgi:hypothetical protein